MATATTIPSLKAQYYDEIQAQLKADLDLPNVMMVPKLDKISVNMGVGEAALNKKAIEGAITDLSIITGQKPSVTKAKKSIASFKLREDQVIGARVTLRGDRMYAVSYTHLTLPTKA